MAKFCGNCGAKMDDEARVCGNCGTPFDDAGIMDDRSGGTVPPKPPKPPVSPEKKKKIKAGIAVAAVAAVLVVVLIIGISIVSNNTGYKGAINKWIRAYSDYNIETLMDVTSDIKYNNVDKERSLETEVAYKLDFYENEVGRDPKISYEITDSYKLTDRKYDSFIRYVESSYKYDSSDISEIRKVDLKLEVSGKQRSKKDSMSIYVVKERGKWYVFDGYVGTNY